MPKPEASFSGEWANAFPFGMAAACAYHLSRNHAFVDGNKRVGLAAAVVFLFLNGWELESLHPVMEDVAQGKIERPELGGDLRALGAANSSVAADQRP